VTAPVVGIVQARMESSRFPGKVMAEIHGLPMIRRVVDRLRGAASIDLVVVAISDRPADDELADYCAAHAVECFRGSSDDVLDRFYRAALRYSAGAVARITGDCPLVDPRVVDRVVETFRRTGDQYVTNTLRGTYPDGLDVEVFSFDALAQAWRDARRPAEREHVTPYIRTSGRFTVRDVESEVDCSARDLRWTVDHPADLEFVRAVYRHLAAKPGIFGMADVLALLDREPSLLEMNRGIVRNEGYYMTLAKEPQLPARPIRLDRSYELKARAERLIPSCTQTFSKGPTQYVQGAAPVFLARGEGSHVWDVDGNEYIDYPMALGAIILGHNEPAVTDAVTRQIAEGTSFSLAHPLEVEVAEVLVDLIPCAEMVRFGKNGSDATSGAVRLARAYTDRDIIACCGYHGWQDWYIGTTTRNKGVPQAVRELTVPFEYNDIQSLERIFAKHRGRVAGVIMEPVGVVDPQPGFLQAVADLARAEGALLIYDEVLSGFRFALGGAQEYYGVAPDIAAFGKAMANGYPISAVVGRRHVMELFDEVFFSFTYGGDTVALAATVATIDEMRKHNVIGHIWAQGQKLKDGFNILTDEFGLRGRAECVGLAPRSVMTFKDDTAAGGLLLKSLFQQECVRRGVLFSGGMNLCYRHSDADVEHTLRVYRAAFAVLAEAIKTGDVARRLEGEPVKPVFRQP
jgi:glutamate-1-semialdehyde aminotransferase/spore coat polysaccharide biosynthesis protein SpsF (cytidylyltransferase family)